MDVNTFYFALFGMGSNPLNQLFGWMARVFFDFFGSYGIAIIVLTIIVRGALIPLNVRSQRSMIKQQALSSKQAEIRRKYPDDKNKQNEEISNLLKENGAAPLKSCMLPLLQLIFIFPIYAVVRAPLRYISQVSTENLEALGEMLGENGRQTIDNNIPAINILRDSPDLLRQAVSEGLIRIDQLISMDFLGLDLSMTPQWRPDLLFGSEWQVYVPLLIIPLLVLATTLIQTRVTNVLKPTRRAEKEAKEAKERSKSNPARSGQVETSSMESSMKMMLWMMPLIMLFTTFILPAAMAFYWIVGNIMGILQQFIIFFMFTKPYEQKLEEMEEKKKRAFSKSSKELEENSDDQPKGKKAKKQTDHKKRYSSKKKDEKGE